MRTALNTGLNRSASFNCNDGFGEPLEVYDWMLKLRLVGAETFGSNTLIFIDFLYTHLWEYSPEHCAWVNKNIFMGNVVISLLMRSTTSKRNLYCHCHNDTLHVSILTVVWMEILNESVTNIGALDRHCDIITGDKRETHHGDGVNCKIRVYPSLSSANQKRESALSMRYIWIHIYVYEYPHAFIIKNALAAINKKNPSQVNYGQCRSIYNVFITTALILNYVWTWIRVQLRCIKYAVVITPNIQPK